jgi:hypothetical protein
MVFGDYENEVLKMLGAVLWLRGPFVEIQNTRKQMSC